MNPGASTLASIRIVTDDVPRLSGFYSQLTGVQGVGDPNAYMELALPGAILAITSRVAIEQYNHLASASGRNHSVLLEFAVDDVDAERQRLDNLITDWAQQPTDQPWGNRAMLFRDPDGNLINFFTVTRRDSPLRRQH